MAPKNIKHCLIQYCHLVVLFIPDVSEYNYLSPLSSFQTSKNSAKNYKSIKWTKT